MIKNAITKRAKALIASRKPDFVIGPSAEEPYMLRWWWIPRNRFLNIYVHVIMRNDDDLALHDHPWPSLSLLIVGQIDEAYRARNGDHIVRRLSEGEWVFRGPKFLHRLMLPGAPAITVFITGPRIREWGFACPRGWVHWRDFVAKDDTGSIGRGCGEYDQPSKNQIAIKHLTKGKDMQNDEIPKGYMKNAEGALMPISKVKPAHLEEDKVVRRLLNQAKAVSAELSKFKDIAMGDAQAFRAMVAEQYGATKGGAKGNMTLRSYDGEMMVQVQVSETIDFGVELQAAKELIDECIATWSKGSNANIKVLVNDAFRVNKERNIDTGRVLGLRRLDIDDETWGRAMDAISDAVRVTGSRTYIRFYETNPKGDRQAIPLDLASA